jgi:hypothetical protein
MKYLVQSQWPRGLNAARPPERANSRVEGSPSVMSWMCVRSSPQPIILLIATVHPVLDDLSWASLLCTQRLSERQVEGRVKKDTSVHFVVLFFFFLIASLFSSK